MRGKSSIPQANIGIELEPLTDIQRAQLEFQQTGTLRPQMIHVEAEDNYDNHAFDLYFEAEGPNAQPVFANKLQAALDRIKIKSRSDGNDRFIIKYFPHINRIVWSPSVNSDMNIENAIGAICGENAVPDPREERYHVEITNDRVDMVATNIESARRLLAFLETAIPSFVHATRFIAQITLENGTVNSVYNNIDHLKDEIGKLSSF